MERYIKLTNARSITIDLFGVTRKFRQGICSLVSEREYSYLMQNQYGVLFTEVKKNVFDGQDKKIYDFEMLQFNSHKEILSRRNKVKKIDMSSLKDNRILFVRPGGIGDILYTFCVASYIKSIESSVRIALASGKKYLKLLPFTRSIDWGLEYNGNISSEEFDQVASFIGAVEANKKAEKLHYVDAYYDWLGIDYNSVPEEYKVPKLFLTDTAKKIADEIWERWSLDKHITIGLALRASSKLRSWHPEYNKKLALAFAKRGIKVLLFDSISTLEFGGKNILSYCGNLGLEGLVGCVSKLDLLIAPDTGLLHIAGSLGIPAVGIYSSFNPELRVSKYKNVLYTKPSFKCAPCYHHIESQCKSKSLGDNPPCMTGITPKEVFLLARKLIHNTRKIDIARL